MSHWILRMEVRMLRSSPSNPDWATGAREREVKPLHDLYTSVWCYLYCSVQCWVYSYSSYSTCSVVSQFSHDKFFRRLGRCSACWFKVFQFAGVFIQCSCVNRLNKEQSTTSQDGYGNNGSPLGELPQCSI